MQTLKLTKKYEKYPEYKDSGVEWLGNIPENWSVYKMKTLGSFSASGIDKKINDKEIPVKLLNYTNVYGNKALTIDGKTAFGETTTTKDKITDYSIKKGDIYFTPSSETEKDIGVSSVALEDIPDAVFSYHLIRFRPKAAIDISFSKYFTNNSWVLSQFSSLCNGTTRMVVNRDDFKNINVVLPTKKDQEKIADYLNEKTSVIDEIIEKKEKLIELSKEKRTSVINTVISEVVGEKGKLKNYIQLNPSKKGISAIGPEDAVSFVPMEAISELGELQIQERKYKDVSSGFTYFKDGDVVLAKITPCYENGKAGVIRGLKNGFGFGTTEFMVLRPSNKILADYLYYVVFSDKFRKMGEVEMRGTAGQKRVTSSFAMNYGLFIPDIKTQEKIVVELNKKMKMFDVAIAKVETSISYLKEFKTSLISNVVTGKIKV